MIKFKKNQPTVLIAEIGMNHNGDVHLGKEMISAAAEVGADIVKFQSFKTENFLSKDFPDFSTRKKHELSRLDHEKLINHTLDCGIQFLSTPFDHDSVDMLEDLGVSAFKIASADLSNFPLLEKVFKTRKPIILSTGYSTISKIFKTYEFLQYGKENELCIMHCVASYPTQDADINLSNISSIKGMFQNAVVGFSDHSLDNKLIPSLAVSLGAKVIEKHFTIDRKLSGYDHHMSLTPEMFLEMKKNIRRTELCIGLPRSESGMIEAEKDRNVKAGRSLYWSKNLKNGDKIKKDDLILLRPGGGISSEMIDIICEHNVCENIEKGTLVQFYHLTK